MPPRTKEKKVEPIPTDQRKEWNALVKETREIVARRDATVFDLILLAGKVTAVYGENRLGRWADEAGVGFQAAKQYRWLSKAGVNEDFIKKYARTPDNPKGLSYTVIREVAQFAGSLSSRYAVEYLDWALEHKATAVSIRGYMLEITAPSEKKDQMAKDLKMALQDKQEHEGFSDFLKVELEKIAEARPDLEEQILGTIITNEKDLTALKIAAGFIDKEQEKVVEESKKALDKIKRFRKWIREHSDSITEGIRMGHEYSDELQGFVNMLMTDLRPFSEIDINRMNEDDPAIVEMDL